MTRAELMRRRAEECLTRARSLNDRAEVAPAAEALRLADVARAEAIAGRVLLELSSVEREMEAA